LASKFQQDFLASAIPLAQFSAVLQPQAVSVAIHAAVSQLSAFVFYSCFSISFFHFYSVAFICLFLLLTAIVRLL